MKVHVRDLREVDLTYIRCIALAARFDERGHPSSDDERAVQLLLVIDHDIQVTVALFCVWLVPTGEFKVRVNFLYRYYPDWSR
jgi:hypothetical protein